MDKKQADTLALHFTHTLLKQNLFSFQAGKNDSRAKQISEFAQWLSESLQKDFGDIDLAIFQDRA